MFATPTHTLPTTYSGVPIVPAYDATGTLPYPVEWRAAGQESSFVWPVVGVVGAICAVAMLNGRGEAGAAVAEADLESATSAAHIALLAVGGQTEALTRRDALLAGAGMLASVPLAACAEESTPEAPSEAPSEAPKPPPYVKGRGPFDAPIRKADQSKIGVSRVDIPKTGKGNVGAQIPEAKIYTEWKGKANVIGPGGASGNSTYGFWAGGETKLGKPNTDYSAPKK
jgi:hypothetical protein